jgi:multimeric flavodoxin WrbA
MKAFILNGLEKKDDALYEMISDLLKHLNWEINTFSPQDRHVAPCQGCFGCWTKTPGICVIDDDGRDVVKRAVQSDMIVFLSPVTFGGYSSDLKKAIDRLIPIILPFFMKIDGEIHHKPRYARSPLLIGVGLLSNPDEESTQIFKTLVARNAINLHSPLSAAGVVIRDYIPEKMRAEIKTLFAEAGVK